MARKRYQYRTSCVSSTATAIHDMVDNARDVTYETVRKHCDGLLAWAESLGYSTASNRGCGLTLKNDYAVSFHKSKYKGKPCYYVRWSAIEYIWVLEE